MSAAGGLTHEELVVACRNIGYDLTCGACACLFFTGMCPYPHCATCSTTGEQDAILRVGMEHPLDDAQSERILRRVAEKLAVPGDVNELLRAAMAARVAARAIAQEQEHANIAQEHVDDLTTGRLTAEDVASNIAEDLRRVSVQADSLIRAVRAWAHAECGATEADVVLLKLAQYDDAIAKVDALDASIVRESPDAEFVKVGGIVQSTYLQQLLRKATKKGDDHG